MSTVATTWFGGHYDRKRLYKRIDINPDDISLLSADDVEGPTPEDGETGDNRVLQNESGYSSDTADFSSSISNTNRDTTDLQKEDPTKDTMLQGEDDSDKASLITGDEEAERKTHSKHIPSAVVDYYNEAALSTKKRNSLPDSVFGLPRLRMYPLTDSSHVKQAIKMFGHCKDPEDKKTLAANIVKAMETHKVTMKIGKKNPLYDYVPEELREGSELPSFTFDPSEIPLAKRSREDVIKEHLRVNGSFYNNVFYGTEFAKAAKAISEFEFLDFFYPDVKTMPFAVRLECVCGGLAASSCRDEVYAVLGIKSPLETDFNKPLGWCSSEDAADLWKDGILANEYWQESNWFKANMSNDVDHQFFCLKLYSVMGEILLDPNFMPDIHLTDKHYALLMDWNQRVCYHYDLYLDAVPDSEEQIEQIQYLFDLFWNFTDNPHSDGDISVNIIALLREMSCINGMVVNMNEANVSGEIVSREKCNAYLVNDLDMADSLYLLPSSLEYPIVNKDSIRLAMDMIERIDPAQRDEYVENLNKKYAEFGCTFSISVDHPYAKYADKNIIAHMTHMLLEGSTVVDDQGTSSGTPSPAEAPWYKHLDYVSGPAANLLDNKELGPNKKKQQDPEWTPHDSVL